MTTFTLAAGKYDYRPLKYRAENLDNGYDVYAVQTGLQGLDYTLEADGWFGTETQSVVRLYQTLKYLDRDGIAGIATQRAIALDLARFWTKEYGIKERLLRGQIEKESGFQLGNHTAPYTIGEAAGSRDCGATQQNSRFTPIPIAFDTAAAIYRLARQLHDKYNEYAPRIGDGRRAWELAAGSWNAPSWTDQLSRGGTLSPAASASIEAYIDRVTTYVRW